MTEENSFDSCCDSEYTDAIIEISCSKDSKESRESRESRSSKESRSCRSKVSRSADYNFTSNIQGLNNLYGIESGNVGCIQFSFRRKGRIVSLQWESFTANMATTGAENIFVCQGLDNLPNGIVSTVAMMKYRDMNYPIKVQVDPFSRSGNLLFYLPVMSNIQDYVAMDGGCIVWNLD